MKEFINTPEQFKSEIDWAKWNPDTHKYPELINEYNQIEKNTKKTGLWMKNIDGTEFNGTPEQFVQQQSSWFKKSFPNPLKNREGNIQTYYHITDKKLAGNFFDENMFKWGKHGKGIYISPNKPKKELEKEVYQLYINSNNPQNIFTPNDFYKVKQEFWKLRDIYFAASKAQNDTEKKDILKKIADNEATYQNMSIAENNNANEYLREGFDSFSPDFDREYVIPFSNCPKSAIGNVGLFDLNDPNIYK